jgi:hypothetical protein
MKPCENIRTRCEWKLVEQKDFFDCAKYGIQQLELFMLCRERPRGASAKGMKQLPAIVNIHQCLPKRISLALMRHTKPRCHTKPGTRLSLKARKERLNITLNVSKAA